MNPRLRPSIIPQCSACVRNYLESGLSTARPLLQHQTRGAKSSKRPDTIPVQLLKDLDSYGRAGTYVSIPTGMMRNKWYPHSVARYPTFEERRAIKRGDIDIVRDYEFLEATANVKQRPTARSSADAAWQKYISSSPSATDFKISTIEPSRAIGLLDALLPESLDFERVPVPKSQSTESKSKLPASVQAMLKASMPEVPDAIYGSVSNSDIVQSIRDAIAHNDEAAQIHVNESNIELQDLLEGDDATKFKHLGQYKVEITMKGVETTVTRRITIRKPQEQPAEASIDPSIEQASATTDAAEVRV